MKIIKPITDIFFVGPAGIGKGTMARVVACLKKATAYIEMSAVFKWAALHHPELLKGEGDPTVTGKLYSDACATACYVAYTDKKDVWGASSVNDGVGRTVPQALDTCKQISVRRTDARVVVLDCTASKDIAVQRANEREVRARKRGGEIRLDVIHAESRYDLHEENREGILQAFRMSGAEIIHIDASGTPRENLLQVIGKLGYRDYGIETGIVLPNELLEYSSDGA